MTRPNRLTTELLMLERGPVVRVARVLFFLTGLCGATLAQAQSTLPDTGQDLCYDGAGLVPCTQINTGDAAPYRRQDARFGRDPAYTFGGSSKTGGGDKGFDYTKLGVSGATLAIQNASWERSGNADSGNEAAGTKWSCVRDNITGLVWEVKTSDSTPGLRDRANSYSWYSTNGSTNGGHSGNVGTDNCNGTLPSSQCNTQAYVTAVNNSNLCGANDWRLPSLRELFTLVHFGVVDPSIDVTYFPNTGPLYFWTANTYATNVSNAWAVLFYEGTTEYGSKTTNSAVRLVRGTAF